MDAYRETIEAILALEKSKKREVSMPLRGGE